MGDGNIFAWPSGIQVFKHSGSTFLVYFLPKRFNGKKGNQIIQNGMNDCVRNSLWACGLPASKRSWQVWHSLISAAARPIDYFYNMFFLFFYWVMIFRLDYFAYCFFGDSRGFKESSVFLNGMNVLQVKKLKHWNKLLVNHFAGCIVFCWWMSRHRDSLEIDDGDICFGCFKNIFLNLQILKPAKISRY